MPENLTVGGTTYNNVDYVSLHNTSGDKVNYYQGLTEEDIEEIAETVQANLSQTTPITPQMYGAKGDGTTDDTAYFQQALAENRIVYVPSGTYTLNDTLVIRENCCLELNQDTILKFTQTSRNCIEMRGSAVLRGNHGNIDVTSAFTGNVISVDTGLDGVNHASIPPYLKAATPMWKRQRFIYDVNITRTEGNFQGSLTGGHSGTALYISANYETTESYDGSNTAPIACIWAMTVSGLRIGGAFDYGINIQNRDTTASGYGNSKDPAWNHDMRIEAVIVGCETSVRVFNCNTAHLDVSIQASYSINKVNGSYVNYAKNGIILEHSHNIDLSRSIVWDWYDNNTLYSEENKQNAHIALIGDCRGTILSDHMYNERPEDIRSLIYTDTPKNFDSLIILQEPFTRWFKTVENKPHFYNGTDYERLLSQSEFNKCFNTSEVIGYVNALPNAVDTDGISIYNGTGYKNKGGPVTSAGTIDASDVWYNHTGFIKCKQGNVIYIKGLKFDTIKNNNYSCRFAKYKSDCSFISGTSISIVSILAGEGSSQYVSYYDEENDVYEITLVDSPETEYIRFSVPYDMYFDNAIISVGKKIESTQAGFLHDDIKVKAENVIGLPESNVDVTDDGFLADDIKIKAKNVIGLPECNVDVTDDGYLEDSIKIKAENVIGLPESSVDVTDEIVKEFTDVLPEAVDTDGKTVFNEIGYVRSGYSINSDGVKVVDSSCGCTGYIPVKQGDTVYVHGINIGTGNGASVFVLTDGSLMKLSSYLSNNNDFQTNGWFMKYTALDNGFKLVVDPNKNLSTVAYLRFSFLTSWLSSTTTPMVAINEEIKYYYAGFLADSIKVKGENVTLQSPDGKLFKLVVNNDGTLSTTAQ